MEAESFMLDIGIIVACAAALSWLAMLARQPIIIAYLLCGIIVGPWGLGFVEDVHFVDAISRIGVTLLLFLAGIVLRPRRLIELFRKTALVTLGSCVSFFLIALLFAWAWDFSAGDGLFIALALMFSSTILVVKLLPTTTLHQRHMGAFCISILILQDLIAIGILWFMRASGYHSASRVIILVLRGIMLIAAALAFEQFVLRRIMRHVERFHETLYLLSLGWCLGMAMLSNAIGFSHEVGAFIAGVALARSPIALFVSEGLKFFRDFFLVLFFFVLGARLDLFVVRKMVLPAILLGSIFVATKPLIFNALFRAAGEQKGFSRQAAIRLGQTSEFSLIIAVFAVEARLISAMASQLIQLTTIVTMIVSCYWVVFVFPTPLGVSEGLKQD
jgi:glutathione-regulated potassium-efflux system ancillary protein KefC